MVVEHTFVTTIKPVDALRMASEFLGRHGFASHGNYAFALDGAGWTTVDLRRGKLVATKASIIRELPQHIRIEWDRGRILVAASIADRHSKKQRTELLMAIVNGLENLLVVGMPAETAGAGWDLIESQLARRGRRAKIVRWIVIGILTALIVVTMFIVRGR